jgi:sulfide:quinone oxidoreductase
MWLLEDTLKSVNKRNAVDISFWTPGAAMFGVKYYSDKLESMRKEKNVDAFFKETLVEIDPDNKIATFENMDSNKRTQQHFDMLHVAPHMSAPTFIKESPLSDQAGFVDVDKFTMQSNKFDNVFALGDCTNTPNSKTAAAITSQAPVLVHNLKQKIMNKDVDGVYTGYASCPLIISRGHTMMAEFGYGGRLMETFSRETGKFPLKYIGTEGDLQMRFFYLLKERLFPFVYWNLWTKGAWYGTNGPIKPSIVKKEDGNASAILGTSEK